ncbi:ISChy4, transposase, partial [mine drainage metagenome]
MNIFDLKQQGLSYREIARETGHSRNTVHKYLRDGASSKPIETKPQRNSKLDPYKSEVDRLVSEGLLSVPAIMSRIVPLGYTGKESI